MSGTEPDQSVTMHGQPTLAITVPTAGAGHVQTARALLRLEPTIGSVDGAVSRALEDEMDSLVARSYVGKHLLVGITYCDHTGAPIRRVQVHGRIVSVDEQAITLRLHASQDDFTLPPDLEALQPAAPGDYTLHSTGEIVVNPDLVGTWTVVMAPPGPE